MMKTRHMIASAPIAIAAMAALHAPAAIAQDAPTIVLDMPAPAPAPAPVASQPVAPAPIASPAPIVLPAPAPAPIAIDVPKPAPVVDPPVVKQADPVATTQTTRRPEPQPRAQTPQTAPAVTAEPVAPEAAPIPAKDSLANMSPADSQPLAATEPVPEPVGDPFDAALLFALLGLGGVALAGAFLFRRRRRSKDVPVIERPVVASAAPLEQRDRAYDVEPLGNMPAEPATSFATDSDAPVRLPAEKPRDPAERDRLLKRMIDAEPDRANPFVSHKARAKRARLILQSIGTRFTDRKPGIDLSQYTNVWPELRGWRPATA
ncbi:hypothetical protein [Qipengyuania mesophila]|uniref:hypothetical protein n=2 Tax=Qipengyuania mesophila TaxID=2867246 RepID=UPI0035123DFD